MKSPETTPNRPKHVHDRFPGHLKLWPPPHASLRIQSVVREYRYAHVTAYRTFVARGAASSRRVNGSYDTRRVRVTITAKPHARAPGHRAGGLNEKRYAHMEPTNSDVYGAFPPRRTRGHARVRQHAQCGGIRAGGITKRSAREIDTVLRLHATPGAAGAKIRRLVVGRPKWSHRGDHTALNASQTK